MCTAIQLNYPQGAVLGRTMDFEVPLDYNGLYLPAGYPYAEDLEGNPLISDYRTLGMCFHNANPLKDGINEKGLVGLTNLFISPNLYSTSLEPGKRNLSSLHYLSYALATYASVDQLVADLDQIHLASKNHLGQEVLAPDFHYIFTDPSQKTVVVQPEKKKLKVFDNPYQVLTNSPGFRLQEKRLKKLFHQENLADFNGAKDLPGGYDPSSRFLRAYYMTQMSLPAENSQQALGQAYSILDAMKMPMGFVPNAKHDYYTYTRYISCYDTEGLSMYIKTEKNPQVFQLSLEDLGEEKNRLSYFFNQDFTSTAFPPAQETEPRKEIKKNTL